MALQPCVEAPGSGLNLVVAGYYGCGNLGDDALLLGLLKGLEGRHEVTALSGNTAATEAAFQIGAVPRRDIFASAQAIRNADALVFGGGGILQDTTSLMSLKYYTHMIETAANAGKKIALIGQGIGPITSFFGKRAARRAFSKCDLITTRDEGSMRLVEKIGAGSKAKLAVTDDLAWLAAGPTAGETAENAVAISARPWKSLTGAVIEAFKGFCEKATGEGWKVVPVSFDRVMDDEILEQITSTNAHANSPQEMFRTLVAVKSTVAMRLHAGIFSAAVGVVPTMVSYDDKVTAFAESIGSRALPVEEITADSLWQRFQESLADSDRLAAQVRVRREVGVEKSRLNMAMLEDILQSGRTRSGV